MDEKYFNILYNENELEGGQDLLLGGKDWHLLPVVEPSPDEAISGLLPTHFCGCFSHYLHTPDMICCSIILGMLILSMITNER